MRFATLLLVILTLAAIAGRAVAQTYGMAPKNGDAGSNADKRSGFDMKRGNMIPADLEFYDHHDKPVKIKELLGNKPAIFVLAYYRCPMLCNLLLQDLLQSMRTLANGGFICGRDYNVITVGIDPKETQHIARIKRLSFYKELDGRSEEENGWWFLTPGHGQGTDTAEAERKIHKLADAVGFWYTLRHKGTDYQYKPETNEWLAFQTNTKLRTDARDYEYIHASGFTILTPEGKVSQYFMGHAGEKVESDAPLGQRPYRSSDIRMALVEASNGQVGTKIDQIMMYCYAYDETKGHYRPIMRTLGLAAAPFVLLLFGIIALAIRNSKKVGYNLPELAGIDANLPNSTSTTVTNKNDKLNDLSGGAN